MQREMLMSFSICTVIHKQCRVIRSEPRPELGCARPRYSGTVRCITGGAASICTVHPLKKREWPSS